MKNIYYHLFKTSLIAILFLIIAFTVSCKRKSSDMDGFISVNPAFKTYVDGFTTSYVTSDASIKVRFQFEIADSNLINKFIENDVFSFKPKLNGKNRWIDSKTLEFVPDEKLKNNVHYIADLNLKKIIQVPDSLSNMKFSFRTVNQDYDIIIEKSRAYSSEDLTNEFISGVILTADIADEEQIKQTIKANQGGTNLKINWIHSADKRKHSFTIENIKRDNKESYVNIKHNGKPLNVSKYGSIDYKISSLKDFSVSKTRFKQFPENTLSISFSDPLNQDQEMEGLISVGKISNYSYVIDFNELIIFPGTNISGDVYLKINENIKNSNNKKLGTPYVEKIEFQDAMPNVRLIHKGTILPSGNNKIIPFEAINLSAVDVSITKIYQNNIHQFLQNNELSGRNQMSRVGKLIVKKTIPLSAVANVNTWNRFYIDLSELINTEPGAIYSVEIGFRKEHSIISCEGEVKNLNDIYSYFNETFDEENWEYIYDDYYYYDYEYDYEYGWSRASDPCSNSYYNKKINCNILSTDIGLSAKLGEDKSLIVIANNINTNQSLSKVDVEVYDYRNQLIAKTKTNSDGIAIFKNIKSPFLIVAKNNNEQSYLKLGNANSLSTSSFDVSGDRPKEGIKGFIYTERGVWRPGDSIFISFILEDKLNNFPENLPVVFELFNPLGNMIEKRAVSQNLNKLYSFHTRTQAEAQTGTYRLKVSVGRSAFYKNLMIETIRPNRLRINLSTPQNFISISNNKEVSIQSEWLHGAKAKNLKAEVDVKLSINNNAFPKFKDYQFTDISKTYYSDNISLFEGRLNEEGNVSFIPELKIESAPGFLNANIETRVYEPGGEFSIDYQTLPLSPYKTYAGIKNPEQSKNQSYFLTGRNYTFNVINLTEDGKFTNNNNLKLEIYKVNWRYWWSSYNDANGSFLHSYDMSLVSNKSIALSSGKGNFSLKIDEDDWGKYYIKITDTISNHSCGSVVFFDWSGYNRFSDKEKTSASMLTFSTEKQKYKTGEKIKMTINVPVGSRAYISLENGTQVIENHNLKEKNNKIEFETVATSAMTPNIYIWVSLIQSHSNTADGLPMRLYGVVPITVEDPNTILQPKITSAESFKPNTKAKISVSETSGKAMTYTLAIVDEGLLNLTKFKTPDPYSNFYAKEALGVKTWDIYDQVIGAWSGEIKRILSIGGGGYDDEISTTGQRANRFIPMVRFIGPFELGRSKTNTHEIDIPEYVGSVRIMAVAAHNRAYGSTEKTVAVKSPLMILGTAPRVVGPKETFSLAVNIFAMESKIKNVNLRIKTNDMLEVEGSNSVNINFNKPDEKTAFFNLKSKSKIGIAQILVEATSGNEKAVWKIEIDVRPSNPMITKVRDLTIKEGETKEIKYSDLGIEGTNSNLLEISTFIPMNIDKWLSYLLDYPHGCSEQTISGAFPMLYINELAETNEKAKSRADTKIKFAISKMQSQQLSSGGISMWPGSQYTDDWVTSYAGHFALEAKDKSYNVSNQFINKWKNFQKNKARTWKNNKTIYNNDINQAYRLYTLALAKDPEIGAMNRLAEDKFLSNQARWILASAYAIIGRNEISKRIINNFNPKLDNKFDYAVSYGSSIRDKSFILECYLRLNMQNQAYEILKEIASDLSNNSWLSTQTAAQCLRTVSLYLKQYPMGKQMNFSIKHAGKSENIVSKNTTHTFVLNKGKNQSLQLTNSSKGTLNIRLIQKGIPLENDESDLSRNLNLNLSYKDIEGNSLNTDSLLQGTIFYAEIKVSNASSAQDISSLALTQIIPSGWEVMNDRIGFGNNLNSSNYTYQDIRDDRVLTYFDLSKTETKTFRIRLSASYAGKFYLPMVYCEAMYNNSVYASLKGKWIVVYENK